MFLNDQLYPSHTVGHFVYMVHCLSGNNDSTVPFKKNCEHAICKYMNDQFLVVFKCCAYIINDLHSINKCDPVFLKISIMLFVICFNNGT